MLSQRCASHVAAFARAPMQTALGVRHFSLSAKTGEGGNGLVYLNSTKPDVAGPPRDFEGYAWNYPDPKWPKGAKLAINLVVNFEEGSEASFHHGDNITEVIDPSSSTRVIFYSL